MPGVIERYLRPEIVLATRLRRTDVAENVLVHQGAAERGRIDRPQHGLGLAAQLGARQAAHGRLPR